MLTFPNAKINLGLHVHRKRADGYHDIDTVFYPVPLTDALEIIPLPPKESTSSFPFSLSGAEVKGRLTSNLCVLAYKMLKKDHPQLPKIKMHLHKIIPSGAGLGGGSSDAAFTLVLLNKMFNLGISTEKLMQYAAELGSDCPFFIINRPCFGCGRGEVLQPVDVSLSAYTLIIVNPGIHVDTGLAFLNIIPAVPEKSVKDIITTFPVERWKDELHNDFEKVIFPRHPEIVDIKDELYRKGAIYASMSGSGSTVYGIFKKGNEPHLTFPPHYFVKRLSGQLQ
jgi:4-diphosphocytidyl-2-C-methyl-D-erythritol kinase